MVWANTFYWNGRSVPIQEASCLFLCSVLWLPDYKDLFSLSSVAETRAPAQGRSQGGLEESAVAYMGLGDDLADSPTLPNSFGSPDNCEAIATVLSYHNSLLPLLSSPPENGYKMMNP